MGIVVEMGSKVPQEYQGTRRAFLTRGGQSPEHGAFAEYIAMPYDITCQIPSSVTDEQAATVPIPFFTAAHALFQPSKLGLREPPLQAKVEPKGEYFLVWGASTAVGMYAVQLANLAGYQVVATASEAGWPLLKEFGAEHCFDYKDAQVAEKIKLATNGTLKKALDWYD